MERERNAEAEIRERISEFVAAFSDLPDMPHAENLYDRSSPEGTARAYNVELYLQAMLEHHPRVLLVGEAPGYQGTRRTGVPFASEFMLAGGMPEAPFFTRHTGFRRAFQDSHVHREPTSTIMWRTISRCESLPLLWAAFSHHPHEPGSPLTNRAPTRREVVEMLPMLERFITLFDINQILAVGNTAKATLDMLGINAQKLRHPSRGGATIFAQQLYEILPPKAAS